MHSEVTRRLSQCPLRVVCNRAAFIVHLRLADGRLSGASTPREKVCNWGGKLQFKEARLVGGNPLNFVRAQREQQESYDISRQDYLHLRIREIFPPTVIKGLL